MQAIDDCIELIYSCEEMGNQLEAHVVKSSDIILMPQTCPYHTRSAGLDYIRYYFSRCGEVDLVDIFGPYAAAALLLLNRQNE